MQPPSVYGLLALGALGLLTDDETLTTAAFQELLPYQTDSRYVADISRLSSYQQSLIGNELQGQREIVRNIHMLPNVAELWTLLASFKASLTVQTTFHPQTSDGLQVARWAEIAFDARRQSDSAVDHVFQPIDLSQVISLISLGYLLARQGSASLIAAQKAVHCNPHSAASWSVLLAAALPSWGGSDDGDQLYRLGWLKKLIEHLRRKCDVTAYSRLTPWLGHYERRLVSILSKT